MEAGETAVAAFLLESPNEVALLTGSEGERREGEGVTVERLIPGIGNNHHGLSGTQLDLLAFAAIGDEHGIAALQGADDARVGGHRGCRWWCGGAICQEPPMQR